MNESYIDVIETSNKIICWAKGEDNQLYKTEYHLSDYLYCFMPDNTGEEAKFTDIYKNPLKKVKFDDKWDLRDFSTKRHNLCDSDVQAKYKFIRDEYRHSQLDSPYNVLFFDIETDVDLTQGRGYATIHDPFSVINSIQCFDAARKRYVMFIPVEYKDIVKLKDKKYPVDIFWCDTESEILLQFAEYIDHIDILTGWNSDSFDVPYMIARGAVLFGEDFAKSMLCRDGHLARKRVFTNDFGEESVHWTLKGRVSVDMMLLYKKFFPGEKKSFSLDNVCEEDLGIKKIAYEEDLGVLFRTDPQKFYEYGLRDALLLMLLDEKHAIISLAVMLARKCCVLFADVTGSVKPIECAISAFCIDKGIILPDAVENEKEKFEGAIVYDTISGRHPWTFTIDLGSLYPSVMIMLGLSPETMIIQCQKGMLDFIEITKRNKKHVVSCLVTQSSEVFEILASDLFDLIKESGYTISANGTIFDGSMGILSEFVLNGVETRDEFKRLAKQSKQENDMLKYGQFDRRQQVIKILNNSVYGVTGEKRFKLYDLRLSKSITLTGQMISKYQAYKGNEYIKELSNV